MTIDPRSTAYGRFLNDPRFPSDGTLPDQYKMFQPRLGLAWDLAKDGKSVLRASAGIYNARQNMLTQVGSITTNGVQQQTIFLNSESSRLEFPAQPGQTSPFRRKSRQVSFRCSQASACSAAITKIRAFTPPTSRSSRKSPAI
jgi:hypothetical protein